MNPKRWPGWVKYEAQMWLFALLKQVPGSIGYLCRNILLPYSAGRCVTIHEMVHIERPSKLRMGNNVSVNRGTVINAEGGVVLGNDVLVGPFVTIYSQNHRFDRADVPIRSQGYRRAPVAIGDDVWLAAHVVVLPGVSIGPGTVVAAGSIVTRDLPAGVIAAGTPAQVIRQRHGATGADRLDGAGPT